jgi:L-fuconolactonase
MTTATVQIGAMTEPILEPSLEIVDPHHHLGEQLQPAYLLPELLRDVHSGHHTTQTVFVECGWDWDWNVVPPARAPVREVRRVAELAVDADHQGGSIIAGIVGHVDLRLGHAVAPVLDELLTAGQGRLVGIRHVTAWDASPDVPRHRTRPTAGLMANRSFRAGFAQIVERGLAFDAWLYHTQIDELTDLAIAFPDARIVLDHFGGPLSVGPYRGCHGQVLAQSRLALQRLSSCENVFLKLGGIAMPMMAGPLAERDQPPSSTELAAYWAPHLRWCIETFGVQRCMFESNFPMDRVMCSYRLLWNAFKRIAADATANEKTALFSATARDVYGLPTPAVVTPAGGPDHNPAREPDERGEQ